MNKKTLLKAAVQIALGISLASALPLQSARAASSDGSLLGKITSADNTSLSGVEVTARNPDTGFSRTVKADADGQYRFPFLPVGKYTLEANRDGRALGKLADVTVALGAATTADVTVNVSNVEEVFVVGTRVVTAVDVKSTESATNLTREELLRLPVERDIMAAAMLAPGLSKGDAGLCAGGNCGVSFGGSSIAENSVYINGLNVTDFYNRVGSSSVPYSFYKEFQVKTGGYSVEFGRTTGGVINAVTRSGTNEFEFGTDVVWEPNFLQASAKNRYDANGNLYYAASHDEYDRQTATVYASGPIVKDKLFFFALYEARNYEPKNTSNSGNLFYDAKSNDGFWGAKVDWQINDKHLLELLAFSDKNSEDKDSYDFDMETGSRGAYQNTEFTDDGGLNWAVTYTGYLLDSLSMKVLYGKNEREFSGVSSTDLDCNRIRDRRDVIGQGDVGCTRTTSVTARTDDREAARLDFEWVLGEHQLRFGMDHEVNTSNHDGHYPGPGRLVYEVFSTSPGSRLSNGGIVPDGVDTYVRTRRNEVSGEFETVNSAYYLEDNWSITPSFLLNAGVRVEAFDNKNSDGDSYIKMDNMIAPRFGFSWDVKGDNRSKIFGNAGRYFLPVANVINIKQAGGFLDERTYYVFGGFAPFEYNGQTYQMPELGAQIGPVDNSQGDGTVGDLRDQVDADMDPVYQDELILGFQSMIDDKWSWGVRGIYRKLNNAIDDMNITSNGIYCGGEPTSVGFVMANPGRPLTVYTDTNCDGENDAYVTIDTSRAGWAGYYQVGEDVFYTGVDTGYSKPDRTYKAVEFVIDRAWDGKWSFSAAYTLSFSKGNAEGPVNSDTDFADTGRTEAFDDPWVNYGGTGYLPNDHRHQFKLRGAYALTENWEFGATLTAQSGRPYGAFGVGNPFDANVFHSLFVCVENCDAEDTRNQVYQLRKRDSGGRTPWTYDLGISATWHYAFSAADLKVRLAAYNLLNQQRTVEVDDIYESSVGSPSGSYGLGTGFQSPRYATLQLTLDF